VTIVQERPPRGPAPARRRIDGLAVVGALGVAAVAVTAVLGLFVTPADGFQGDAMRLMYVHVPSAWLAYLAFGVTALSSFLWLWPRTRAARWDRLAGASAELGVLFCGLCLVTGMLWGRPIWGAYWAWDARLVTTAVLFFLYLGYLSLRRVPTDAASRARRSSIAALVAFVDVPIVHRSVVWWRTLHQDGTVFNDDLDVKLDGSMAWTLLLAVMAWTLVYSYLLVRRYDLAGIEERLEERALDVAIEQRRAEGGRGVGEKAP
jgi:heme exporter protein C